MSKNQQQSQSKEAKVSVLYVCANCAFFQRRKFKQKVGEGDKAEIKEVTCKDVGITADGKPCKGFILADGVELPAGIKVAKEALKGLSEDHLTIVQVIAGELMAARGAVEKSVYKVDDVVLFIYQGTMHHCKVSEIKANGHLTLHADGPDGTKLVWIVPPARVCPKPVEA